MAILDVLRQAAPVIGLTVPDAVFSSQQRDHVELQAVANEVAQRIAFDEGHDWSRLKALATLTGDGTAASFPLPANYRRMVKSASLWPSATPFTKLMHYPDTDHWLGMEVQKFGQTIGGWTIIGDDIHIKPIVPNAGTVQFYYLRNTIVRKADGSLAPLFTADTDSFVLDERVLKLAVIWQWKANKGQPYAEDMTSFQDALASVTGADQGSKTLDMGNRSRTRAETIAFPGVLGR